MRIVNIFLIFNMLMSACIVGMGQERSQKREEKKPLRQNSFLRVNSEKVRPDSKNFAHCCLGCCYFDQCCVSMYYLFSCMLQSDEYAACNCCCVTNNE